MVLEDVADRAGGLVVARPALDPDRLGNRDLHVVDELPVPDRLEDPVREPQRIHVLDGLFAEVVIDPEDLVLLEVLPQHRVELAGRVEVVTERLLHDQSRPAGRGAALAERVDDRRERARRDCEVVDAIASELPLGVELHEQVLQRVFACVIGEVGRDVVHVPGELVPDVFAEFVACMLLDGVLHVAPEGVVVTVGTRDAGDREASRQQPAQHQRVQRGHQLLVREITGGAEDDERARIRRAAKQQSLLERVRLLRMLSRCGHAASSIWILATRLPRSCNDA